MLRGLDEPWWQGNVLSNLGLTLIHMEDYDRAEQYFTESIALHRSLGDKRVVISSLGNLSLVYLHRGDYKAAAAAAHEFLDQNRLMGDRRNIVHALLTLGRIANLVGDVGEARAHYMEGLLLANEISNWPSIVRMIAGFARISTDHQQWSRATRLLGFVAAQRDRISLNMNPDEVRMYKQALEIARSHIEEAEWSILLREGQTMTFEQAVNFALKD
jgi:tetratricopeptide (TPR) repeat protein